MTILKNSLNLDKIAVEGLQQQVSSQITPVVAGIHNTTAELFALSSSNEYRVLQTVAGDTVALYRGYVDPMTGWYPQGWINFETAAQSAEGAAAIFGAETVLSGTAGTTFTWTSDYNSTGYGGLLCTLDWPGGSDGQIRNSQWKLFHTGSDCSALNGDNGYGFVVGTAGWARVVSGDADAYVGALLRFNAGASDDSVDYSVGSMVGFDTAGTDYLRGSSRCDPVDTWNGFDGSKVITGLANGESGAWFGDATFSYIGQQAGLDGSAHLSIAGIYRLAKDTGSNVPAAIHLKAADDMGSTYTSPDGNIIFEGNAQVSHTGASQVDILIRYIRIEFLHPPGELFLLGTVTI